MLRCAEKTRTLSKIVHANTISLRVEGGSIITTTHLPFNSGSGAPNGVREACSLYVRANTVCGDGPCGAACFALPLRTPRALEVHNRRLRVSVLSTDGRRQFFDFSLVVFNLFKHSFYVDALLSS